jgi:hypothetical protein
MTGKLMLLCFGFADTTWHLQVEAMLGLYFNHQPCKRQSGEFLNVQLGRNVTSIERAANLNVRFGGKHPGHTPNCVLLPPSY